MSRISIIIPVYNCEQYLDACIESVRCQTVEDWELILVDDGSTDNSYRIATKYAEADVRIKALPANHKGVSAARNLGIEAASSEYIMFVDSDDTIEANACELLCVAMEGFDFAVSAHRNLFDDKRVLLHRIEAYSGSVADFCKNIEPYLDEATLQGPCAKVFRKSIISQNRIVFPEHMNYGEDAWFVYTYMRYIRSIAVVSTPTYNYFFHAQGLNNRFRKDKYQINVTLNGMISDLCAKLGVKQCDAKRKSLNRKSFAAFLGDCAVCRDKGEALAAIKNAAEMTETKEAFGEDGALSMNQKVMGALLKRKNYKLLLMFSKIYKAFLLIKAKRRDR